MISDGSREGILGGWEGGGYSAAAKEDYPDPCLPRGKDESTAGISAGGSNAGRE